MFIYTNTGLRVRGVISYACEQDYLRDQISSNRLAVKYLEEKLERVEVELLPDYMGTETKVIEILVSGIKSLKDENKRMRRRIKELDVKDADTHSPDLS
jgi:hypothetical protein